MLLIFGGFLRSHKYPWRPIEWNIKKNRLNNKSSKIRTQRKFSLLLLEKIGFSYIFLYFYIGFHVGSTKIMWNSLYFCARQVQEIPQIYWESVVWISHPSAFQAKEAGTSIQTSAAYRFAIVSVLRIVEMETYFSLLIAGWIIITLLKLGLDSWKWWKKKPKSSQRSNPKNICWTHWVHSMGVAAASTNNHEFSRSWKWLGKVS